MTKLKLSGRKGLLVMLLCIHTFSYAQKIITVKPGKSAGKIMVGKTTAGEKLVQDILRESNGGVCYIEKAGPRLSVSNCASSGADGIGLVISSPTDSTKSKAEQDKDFRNSVVRSVIIDKRSPVINEKGQSLLGKTRQEIKKIYPEEGAADTFDYSENPMLIYYSLGIAFLFDAKTKKSIEVEIFSNGRCFMDEFSKSLSQGIH